MSPHSCGLGLGTTGMPSEHWPSRPRNRPRGQMFDVAVRKSHGMSTLQAEFTFWQHSQFQLPAIGNPRGQQAMNDSSSWVPVTHEEKSD